MDLALFDFDGTITKKDSFIDFLDYAAGRKRFLKGMLFLSPILLAYMFRVIPNWKSKEYILNYFFKDWERTRFEATASEYAKKRIHLIVMPKALDRIKWHRDRGDRIIVVSASIDFWLKDWCNKYELELIATRLEINSGRITGRLQGKNCHGVEKVKRIKEEVDIDDYDTIFAYGNSHGDDAMLDIADVKYMNWKQIK